MANKDTSAGKHAAPQGEGSSKAGARRALLIVGIVLLVVAVAIVAYVGITMWQIHQAQVAYENSDTATKVEMSNASSDSSAAVELPTNPVDFAELQADNPDIYAWIYVPSTNVNYPVVQSSTDDFFYLDHDIDGDYSIAGSIYTQMCNSKSFQDPVTVIYGHDIYVEGTMFHELHNFEDADFFNANDTFYIYTPGHIYTYQIVAAYEYDSRHIMNSFDFSQASVRTEYYASVLKPNSLIQNVRAGATLGPDDKIVQLSTCTSSDDASRRFIVTGKLINDQATK